MKELSAVMVGCTAEYSIHDDDNFKDGPREMCAEVARRKLSITRFWGGECARPV